MVFVFQILSVVGALAVIAVVVASLVSYGSAISFTTGQLVTGAVFPGIGMTLGYGQYKNCSNN